jgi:hypothetical protein
VGGAEACGTAAGSASLPTGSGTGASASDGRPQLLLTLFVILVQKIWELRSADRWFGVSVSCDVHSAGGSV